MNPTVSGFPVVDRLATPKYLTFKQLLIPHKPSKRKYLLKIDVRWLPLLAPAIRAGRWWYSLVSDPRLKRPVCHPDPRAASYSQQNASCDYVPASHGRSIAGVVACEMIWAQMLVGSSTRPASGSFLVFLCLQLDL